MSERLPRADAGPPGPPAAGAGPADTARPLRRDAERNRRRLLDAARDVFADRGFAATLDDVAHAAGLGVGTVYRRFPDKDALVEALFEERITGLVELAEEAARAEDAWEGLAGFLVASSERMAEDRGLRQVVMSPHHGRAGVALARSQLAPRVEGLLRRAQESGQLRPDVAASDVVTTLEAVQVAAEIGGTAHPEHWRRLFAVLLDGLRCPPGGCAALPGRPLDEEELAEAMGRRKHGRRD
ncbi:TetR/AcrR family transcriptional regulator [Kineococcus rubinsiae]|uniref:TetR/AcrR family transcriptional regulator n=1 Tax=Kineococcus rubinsiae TaxID=2609562 RepID=UPI00142FDDA8|nr:TetR/AcrR family transcriptional regulator [Kineococcus rubinsiae]NIZ92870.1 helix-turn-helix transcriptional regulator [Kineococcus rubinsiae]